ncbi:MAG: 30S ribosomal protein S8 [Planctomycetes bacterium]|nr:30S ribosomal protein S8 [Planctomycetota bacterium]MCB9910377.1 30S ribosomal protein S8 [Planctomycetota bacterium]MCB9912012.1 30S ribosomal protein S8 [Planctomycetota bacterium]HPF14232.1 30S ribosomal protein S8 [Planctomycetota bacterium]HRV79956.1 30S ribosomal protein S8 [Planctomycetota bacterium]
MMTDPIADMLTRIRNANSIRQPKVHMPASRQRVGVAQVLKAEGFIHDYRVEPGKPSSTLHINLKYGQEGERVIRRIDRVSKPGRRIYAGVADLRPILRGQGICVISTPKGVISDRQARELKVGGEVLATIY